MPRRRLVPGQSLVGALSARTHNDTVRLLEHADRYGLWAPQQKQPARREKQATIFYARNDTGANLAIGDAVSLDGLGVDSSNYYGELKREITFAAGPVTSSTGSKFGVCVEPIAAGESGQVAVAGACVCKVDIDDTAHYYASPSDGLAHLVSGADSGDAVILWQPGSTGVQECVVRIDKQSGGGAPTCTLYQFEGYKDTGVSTGTTLAWSDTVKIACYPQRSLGDVAGCGLSIVTSPSAYTGYAFTTTTGGLYLIQFIAHPIDNTSYGSLYVQRTDSAGHTVNVPHGYWSTRTTIRVQYRAAGGGESDWVDAAYANGPPYILPSDGMTQYPRYAAVFASGIASIDADSEFCVRMFSNLFAPTGGSGQPTSGSCVFNAGNGIDTMSVRITRLGDTETELSY